MTPHAQISLSTSIITRDRWGRPLIAPPGGGDPMAYTRATTVAGSLDDRHGLERWQQRMVAIGLSERDDLRLSVSAHHDDKRALDRICGDAMDAANANAAATTGTALHALTQRSDEGELFTDAIPAGARADIEAYRRATAPLSHARIEQLMVNDAHRIAGTPDRISCLTGDPTPFIADIKTGKTLRYSLGSIAMQLAIYAHSVVYDPATGTRSETPGLRTDRAMVIHLPAGQGQCDLYWIDITAGWEAVAVANQVRTWRRHSHDLDPVVPFATARSWVDEIAAASTIDALADIWRRAFAAGEWTDALTQAAADRKAEMTERLPV